MARPIDPARDEARARGDKRYIAARPCPLGHVERFVISTGCCTCADIARAEMIAARGGPRRKIAEPKPVAVKAPHPIKIKAPSPMALARARGTEIYIGAPCKLGHVKRYTSSGHCIICNPRKVTAPKVWIEPKPKAIAEPKPRHVSPKVQRERAKKAAEEARKVFAEAHKTTKLGSLLADYRHTVEARQRSRHLDNLVRNLTASASKKARSDDKIF